MKHTRSVERMPVGLISAVPSEGPFFVKTMERVLKGPGAHDLLYRGKVEGKEIVYFISGMGKANAAHAATVLINEYSPALLVNFGVGGAYPSAGLGVGDMAVAEREIYGDEGVLATDGFHGTEYMGIPLLKKGRNKYYNEFPLHRRLTETAVRSAARAFGEEKDAPKVKSGNFVTVSTCTGTGKRAIELGERWDAVCENMEGAAVAHICALYGIPFVEIRGISNIVEDRDTARWDLELASENCCKAVVSLLDTLNVV